MEKIYEIRSVNSKFIQRSKLFIYPLLYIPKNVELYPKETYVSLVRKNKTIIGSEDKKLICLYDEIKKEADRKSEKDHILLNKYFHDVKCYDDQPCLHVFHLDRLYIDHDWNVFLKGQYSDISPLSKKTISDYYKDTDYEPYINSYLYPDKYYDKYADLLDIPVNILEDNIELLSPPDLNKETLFI
jgi:hypothetical protein